MTFFKKEKNKKSFTLLNLFLEKLRSKKLSGLTLVELLVVISILTILAALSVPQVVGLVNRARDASIKADLVNIQTESAVILLDRRDFATVHCNPGRDARVGEICDKIDANSPGMIGPGPDPTHIVSAATATAFCIEVPLNTTPVKFRCVDGEGRSIITTTRICSSTNVACVPIAIVAPGFNFSMSVTPTSGSVVQGASASTTATATLISGATQAVSFSCALPLPAGVSCSFATPSCNPTCSSALTISTTTATPAATHSITVSGTGGGLTRDTTYTLTVTAPAPAFNFSMSVSPTSGSVVRGASALTTATATLISGATQAVSFSCASPLPAGVSCSFATPSCNPTCSSALTISTTTATPAATHSIIVRGTGGGLTRDTPYSLMVTVIIPPDGTTRRAPIMITGSTSGALTDFQVRMSVPFDTDMQANFNDIRFTAADGITRLAHWRESFITSTSAVFWVRVPSIPASLGTVRIYLYYGHPTIPTASNGVATFDFFDDFNDNDFTNNPTWIVGGSSYSASGGYLIHTGNFTGLNLFSTQINVPTTTGLVLEFDSMWNSSWCINNQISLSNLTTNVLAGGATICDFSWINTIDISSASTSNNVNHRVSLNTWNRFKITFYKGTYSTDYGHGTRTVTVSGPSEINVSRITIGGWQHQSGSRFDNIRVRKHASPEPTVGAPGPEQIL